MQISGDWEAAEISMDKENQESDKLRMSTKVCPHNSVLPPPPRRRVKQAQCPSKVRLPWVSKGGIWDVPGFLPGRPGILAVFKKFVACAKKVRAQSSFPTIVSMVTAATKSRSCGDMWPWSLRGSCDSQGNPFSVAIAIFFLRPGRGENRAISLTEMFCALRGMGFFWGGGGPDCPKDPAVLKILRIVYLLRVVKLLSVVIHNPCANAIFLFYTGTLPLKEGFVA